ncbi:lysozyme inhibitor LprI family protein [Chelativorans intermedius]|uniref:Lysozyme inhibitor LprI family protein n=1 Tax=Chelativorans intermedius TaxID=515947 RepID=A0ABV6D5T6_9HYPH|nr:DUF1311 domain-containing protein [Chelativorans intermedius]MCT8997522.1 DUF1311 domain-containing protein [Chelativorans intermedius]
MRCAAILIAGVALVSPNFAFAQDMSKCIEMETQGGMTECAIAALNTSDKKLNELYKRIEARLSDDADTKKLLIQAQRDWIRFRDAECNFQTAGAAGGSIAPALVAMCMDGLTQSRIEDFEGYLNCEEGDLSCPIPAAN